MTPLRTPVEPGPPPPLPAVPAPSPLPATATVTAAIASAPSTDAGEPLSRAPVVAPPLIPSAAIASPVMTAPTPPPPMSLALPMPPMSPAVVEPDPAPLEIPAPAAVRVPEAPPVYLPPVAVPPVAQLPAEPVPSPVQVVPEPPAALPASSSASSTALTTPEAWLRRAMGLSGVCLVALFALDLPLLPTLGGVPMAFAEYQLIAGIMLGLGGLLPMAVRARAVTGAVVALAGLALSARLLPEAAELDLVHLGGAAVLAALVVFTGGRAFFVEPDPA